MRNSILLFVAVLTQSGCSKPSDVATPSAVPASGGPVSVTVVSPKKQTITWTVDQPATAIAFESAPLVAKLPGYVAKVHVDIGDKVKAGQTLAELSIPELIQEAAQKKALIAHAVAQLEQAKQSVVVAQARIEVAEAGMREADAGVARATAEFERWQTELKRVEGLVSQKIIDSQTRDETIKQFMSAKAVREEATAKIASAKASASEARAMHRRAMADESAAQSNVAVAEAENKRVEAMVGYLKITAPFDGVVTLRNIHPGHFIQPSAAKVEALFHVVHFEVVRVTFEVPESFAGRVAIGTKTIVRVPNLSGREYASTITRTAGALSGESRTLRAEIDLPNADAAVKPGSYCTVKIVGTTADATVLPLAAIQYADETTYAYEIRDGKIVKQRVLVGRVDNGLIEVLGKKRLIGSGDWQPVETSDQFANTNLGALTDGQPATVAK